MNPCPPWPTDANVFQDVGESRRVHATESSSDTHLFILVRPLHSSVYRPPNRTITVRAEPYPLNHHQLNPFLTILASLIQSNSANKRDIGVQCLEVLLARRECRPAVWDITGIVAGYVCDLRSIPYSLLNCISSSSLVEILKHRPSPQMSYQVGFCLWLLSFEQRVSEQIDK